MARPNMSYITDHMESSSLYDEIVRRRVQMENCVITFGIVAPIIPQVRNPQEEAEYFSIMVAESDLDFDNLLIRFNNTLWMVCIFRISLRLIVMLLHHLLLLVRISMFLQFQLILLVQVARRKGL